MNLIKEPIHNEIIINKSRFITTIFRINNIDEVHSILSDTKKRHLSANHNCYAYILGDNQEIQKCSDDGEPSKTAGFPMLEVLKKKELTNVLAITTRYFGGIMLGAGGLIRAYSQSVSDALKDVTLYTKNILNVYEVTLDYSNYNLLINSNIITDIIKSTFTDSVSILIGIEKNSIESVIKSISELTSAKAKITFIEEKIIEVIN